MVCGSCHLIADPRIVCNFPGDGENVSPLKILLQSRSWLFSRRDSERLHPRQCKHTLVRSFGLCGPFGCLKKGTARADMEK